MNINVARERLSYVAKTDSITTSQEDFIATHVAIKRLQILNKFEISPSPSKFFTEETIYRRFISNPDDQHQLIAIYGQSGTGKSHLIRWFEARFAQDKPDNEVVIFIRRSDNTLKGTIRQLLDKPEVQGIKNREIYERLVRSSASVAEDKLKDMIYHNFIVEINNDEDDHEITIRNSKRKRLVAFLNNEIIHNLMMAEDGPIEKIYSKIAEHTLVDRDTIAQFEAKDFHVSADTSDEMQSSGADQKAVKMARELMATESGIKEAENIAQYLNQFVDDVIQRCAGIEPSDFELIFLEIRKELFHLGKNLTLFIEDITSFTGVDVALLNALNTPHTGMYSESNTCRISSIIGSTSNYLENNFKDNHKDRVTQYVYIPDDAFDQFGVYEFVGRYLNTMSLPKSKISEWLKKKADPIEYPIHEVTEGKYWEFIEIAKGKKLCLFPFTKRSIDYLYANAMTKGHQTPRYIIRDIIEPIVTDFIYDSKNFPSVKYKVVNINTTLNYRIHSQVKNEQLSDRLLRFMSIWGNGQPEQYIDDGVTYISGIRKEIFEELGFPVINLEEVQPSNIATGGDVSLATKTSTPTSISTPEQNVLPVHKIKRVSDAIDILTKWINGAPIDVSATVGVGGIIRKAREDICKYLFLAINWQASGVSMDHVTKINNSSANLLDFENQTKTGTKGFYTLPAVWESLNIVAAFIRWREYGSESWNYPEAAFDAFLITSWTSKVKDELVRGVLYDDNKPTEYIEAAIAAEIYSLILNGEFQEKSLRKLSPEHLLRKNPAINESTSHCTEWTSLLNVLFQKGANKSNDETVRQYFNIIQGSGGSVVVLDAMNLERTIKKVITQKLTINQEDIQLDDRVRLRRDVYSFYNDIVSRIDVVAKGEIRKAYSVIDPMYAHFGSKDIDKVDIDNLIEITKAFYKTINETQINIPTTSVENVKKQATQIAKALHDIGEVLEEDDSLTILLAFSRDPISNLSPLTKLLTQLNLDIEVAQKQIDVRIARLGSSDYSDAGTLRYSSEVTTIDNDSERLESMR